MNHSMYLKKYEMYVFIPKGVYLIVKLILQKEPITTQNIDLSNNQQ
jgi:hypothetical protein